MKIAICFSGMVRTGVKAYPSIKRFIGDLWGQCDFFMHTWDKDYHNVLTGELSTHFFETNVNLELDKTKLELLRRLYNLKVVEVDEYWPTMGKIGSIFDNYIKGEQWIIPWFYSWHRSLYLRKKYEQALKTKYDIVVKLRPDVIFNENIKLQDLINQIGENDFGINMVYFDNGVPVTDDIVFVSNSKVADKVSDWWVHRLVTEEYMDPSIGTFTQFYNFIKLRGVNPIDLQIPYIGENYKIGLLRQECTLFDPVTEFDKCVECDKVHYHTLSTDDAKHLTELDVGNMREHTFKLRKTLPTNLK